MASNKKNEKPQTKKAAEKAKKDAIKAAESAKAAAKNISEDVPQEKKNIKGIIIAVVALILVAAIVVGVVLVKKNKDNTDNTDTPIVTTPSGESKHTYAEYKGSSLPVEFVEILKKADKDKADACKKYGVALEVGDVEISYSEFIMYYLDQHTLKINDIRQSYIKNGQNRTGYEPKIRPDKQNYSSEGYSWQERFTITAIDKISEDYILFNYALEAGTRLSDEDVAALSESIGRVDNLSTGNDVDDDVASAYAGGVTAAMFKAREIMSSYGYQYQIDRNLQLMEGYSDSEIQADFDKNKDSYSCVSGRVYPIEGEYNESEINAINNEQDFIDYAQKNYPYDNYDADYVTRFIYAVKEDIASVYGDEVGEWMFEPERKEGDLAVVEGSLFRYLVYMETPAMYTTSRDIVFVERNTEGLDETSKEQIIESAKEEYNEWINGGAKSENLAELSSGGYYEGEITARVGMYDRVYTDWIFSDERKKGDKVFLESETGCAMIYYVDSNPEDYDWIQGVRETKSQEEVRTDFAETREKEYKEKRNAKVMQEAYDYANAKIEGNMDNLQLTQPAQQ